MDAPVFEQVAQSCRMLSMEADVGSAVGCSDSYDFCIVGVDEAVAALRCAPAFACVALLPMHVHSNRPWSFGSEHIT